ncbi:MAG: DUF4390 domain-containing protein, partial [Zoogloeaceae bacterium]|nr:DUF4390 domain-containing protein [Zoogloeaceae bacterium]
PGDAYRAGLRLALDVSQLPKPFQVASLTSRDWNLDSGWTRWNFVVPAPVAPPAAPPTPAAETPSTAPESK